MSSIILPLRQELSELVRDVTLRPDPRYIKIAHIRQVLADYGFHEVEPTMNVVAAANVDRMPLGDEPKQGSRSKRLLARIEINAALAERPSIHRKELLKRLIEKGILGSEKNPQQTLAVYLSEYDDLVGDGRGNWSRKPPSLSEGRATIIMSAPPFENEGAS